jgi:2-oxoglutarate dehydrogenase E1 component
MTTTAIHQMILENMRGGVISLDLEGRITTFNRAAENILGLPAKDVIGRPFAEIFLEIPGSDDFVQVFLDAIYQNSVTHHRRVEYPSEQGPMRLAMTTSFLFDVVSTHEQAVRMGVVAVFDDVTEVEALRETAQAMAALRVQQLVRAYRERGHILARLDPLGLSQSRSHPELAPEYYGIQPEESDHQHTFVWSDQPVRWPLGQIIGALERVYCSSVGIQYMHIDDLEIQAWLRGRIEGSAFEQRPTRDTQLRILSKLVYAEAFEKFLQTRFRGAKRFSLEGAETLIPLLDQVIGNAAGHGVTDLVIGMSHRGRLNVLANVLGVPASQLFKRFEQLDSGDDADNDGDVRFHLGIDTEVETANSRRINVSLCFNPSHLEFVGPVVMGRTRARQDQLDMGDRQKVLPVVIHGDAAFSGQGVVQESLNLSRLAGYKTSGAVHIILNNQIGFTTDPSQGRSTDYPSDVARMLQVPIFHVNGEQPEAVCRVIDLAMEFWRTWQLDVVVNLYCYRRRGHMEQDDPSLTQPLMCQAIDAQPGVLQGYTDNLLKLGNVTAEEAEEIALEAQQSLEHQLTHAETVQTGSPSNRPPRRGPSGKQTAPNAEQLRALLRQLASLPEGFTPHAKIRSLLRRRLAMAGGRRAIDWATGEMLAYATLLEDGCRVRVSGQDSERGTFGHRHAVLHDTNTGQRFTPLANLDNDLSGSIQLCNSPLTETAVMAFEFGYSIEQPGSLVVWEAQFGDFANVAQVIIDQFLVSSETKWGQTSSLVLLLPHGLEGHGPEHSSARVERYLQLCANHNVEVIHLLTADQVFHRLRQQALSTHTRPLVAFTPKQLLHNPYSSCSLEDLSSGSFQPVVTDADDPSPERALLCSGQVAAALKTERERRKQSAIIVRIDRLYPLPSEELQEVLDNLPCGAPLIWVQEEPENMGAWRWIRPQLETCFPDRSVRCVSRPERSSPASGSVAVHNREQLMLLEQAFD